MDCVFLIFEQLELPELINVAQVNEEFSTFAASVFFRKYSQLQVVIYESFLLPLDERELLNVVEMRIDTDTIEQVNKGLQNRALKFSKTQIVLENGDLILKIFKHFGHMIKKFKFMTHSSAQPLQSEFIGKLISKYSSESILDIEFENNAEIVLDHITKPLINVENVTFIEVNLSCSRSNELFRNAHRLSLFSLADSDLANFDYHMPNLKHVEMERLSAQHNSSAFPDFIVINPHIRSLSLYGASSEFVRSVSVHLPQLETLTLSTFELQNGDIQFENVITFAIGLRAGYFTSPKNLHFPRLQTLHMQYKQKRFVEWLDFLREHNHLRQLFLETYEMNDSHFQQLTANLSNLVKMTIIHEKNRHQYQALTTNAIAEFLRSHDKLQQLNVLINYPRNSKDELQEQLKHEWNTKISDQGLSFERRTKN